MNIKEAKNYIKDTISAYLKKDEFGDYRISVEKQRPIFLIGAPGIGKTAIMSQIAEELEIALVSYSMTHHTRQSALGLPFIKEKSYAGNTVSVSEYTMSEIIASIYDTMEESGVTEGILFLDEINCVSETLYPSMLQFLQYKVFGKHCVPKGWIIVTAGNPPEFNKAVREFDVVTLDRLKVISVDADYPAWKAYAATREVHGAITGFLDSNRDSFYKVETTAYGKKYVTARGWEDLSDIIKLYEEDCKSVNDNLISQYITDEKIIKDFSAYYDLYNKYKKQYDVEEIFAGKVKESTKEAAQAAPTDERLALTGLLADTLRAEVSKILTKQRILTRIRPHMASLADMSSKDEAAEKLDELAGSIRATLSRKSRAGSLSAAEKTINKKTIKLCTDMKKCISEGRSVKEIYNEKISELRSDVEKEQKRIDNLFSGMDSIFGSDSNEMLVLVTELTLSEDISEFLSGFGSASYEKYSSILTVADRADTLRREIKKTLDEL
ncbi:MAG: AAA family ATPase [Lachnospiraceae bacterium]|nr:AAA family ATPase [Lachnospiraceae bacterium]